MTDFRQFTSFLTLRTPKKAKIKASLKFMISLFGATGFFISGFYLNADLPLSLGFVNIPAFLIFIPITTFMARVGANTVHNMNKVKAQRMFGVFLYVIGLSLIHI